MTTHFPGTDTSIESGGIKLGKYVIFKRNLYRNLHRKGNKSRVLHYFDKSFYQDSCTPNLSIYHILYFLFVYHRQFILLILKSVELFADSQLLLFYIPYRYYKSNNIFYLHS